MLSQMVDAVLVYLFASATFYVVLRDAYGKRGWADYALTAILWPVIFVVFAWCLCGAAVRAIIASKGVQ